MNDDKPPTFYTGGIVRGPAAPIPIRYESLLPPAHSLGDGSGPGAREAPDDPLNVVVLTMSLPERPVPPSVVRRAGRLGNGQRPPRAVLWLCGWLAAHEAQRLADLFGDPED